MDQSKSMLAGYKDFYEYVCQKIPTVTKSDAQRLIRTMQENCGHELLSVTTTTKHKSKRKQVRVQKRKRKQVRVHKLKLSAFALKFVAPIEHEL